MYPLRETLATNAGRWGRSGLQNLGLQKGGTPADNTERPNTVIAKRVTHLVSLEPSIHQYRYGYCFEFISWRLVRFVGWTKWSISKDANIKKGRE